MELETVQKSKVAEVVESLARVDHMPVAEMGVAQPAGGLSNGCEKFIVHEVGFPEPMVTIPRESEPVRTDGKLGNPPPPQDDSVGEDDAV